MLRRFFSSPNVRYFERYAISRLLFSALASLFGGR